MRNLDSRAMQDLEELCALGASRHLIQILFYHLSESTLQYILRSQSLVPRRTKLSWQKPHWRQVMMRREYAAHNNLIITIYRRLEQGCADRSKAVASQQQRLRSIALGTIRNYLTLYDDPFYNADGVYAVIHAYLQGHSHQHHCRECDTQYHTLLPDRPCPICNPPERRFCERCESVFYVSVLETGRKRRLCNGCQRKRSSRTRRTAA